MRRRPGWMLIALLLVFVGACRALWAWLTTPIAVRAYEQIRLGMTPSEVATAIGLPPDHYDSIGPMPLSMSPSGKTIRETGLPRNYLPDAAGRPATEYPEKLGVERWIWDDYWIWVAYDKRHQVIGYYLLEVTHNPWKRPSLFEQMWTWIGF